MVLSDITVAEAPTAPTSTAITTTPALRAFLMAGAMPLESTAFRMMMSVLLAMKFSIWSTWVFRSYLLETVVTFTPGPPSFFALSSAPRPIATKNGLARSPTLTPIDFNGLSAAKAPQAADSSRVAVMTFFMRISKGFYCKNKRCYG